MPTRRRQGSEEIFHATIYYTDPGPSGRSLAILGWRDFQLQLTSRDGAGFGQGQVPWNLIARPNRASNGEMSRGMN